MTSWDDVEARYRELGKLKSFASLVERMLELVATLRRDARFQGFERRVSHASLVFVHDDRYVTAIWSEPDGFGWVGEQGFAISRVNYRELTTWAHVVVDDPAAALLERLEDPSFDDASAAPSRPRN